VTDAPTASTQQYGDRRPVHWTAPVDRTVDNSTFLLHVVAAKDKDTATH
jgi:hypothetical protein